MGYGPRRLNPTTNRTPDLADWFSDHNHVKQHILYGDTATEPTRIEDGTIHAYLAFDWDPCDGGPSGRVYSDFEHRIKSISEIPEQVTWRGDTYEFILDIGCHTEHDDEPGYITFSVRDVGGVSGIERFGWFIDLLNVRADGGEFPAPHGLYWQGDGTGGTKGAECDRCGTRIIDDMEHAAHGVVMPLFEAENDDSPHTFHAEDAVRDDPKTARFCLPCAGEEYGLDFVSHEGVPSPDVSKVAVPGFASETVTEAGSEKHERWQDREDDEVRALN